MTLTELKEARQKKYNQLINDCNIFVAFGENQFKEGIAELREKGVTCKVASMGMGGYIPVGSIKQWNDGQKELEEWYKELEKTLDDKIRLKRVSAEHYDEMLCVLPPAYLNKNVFQVGEPYDHVMLDGKEYPRYASYIQKGDKYYSMGILTTPQVKEYLLNNTKTPVYI